MATLYTLCPHCGFPAIVKDPERPLQRRCRQCRRNYIPEDAAQMDQHKGGRQRSRRGLSRRAALRDYLRQIRRSAI